jgi:hypothetical protein
LQRKLHHHLRQAGPAVRAAPDVGTCGPHGDAERSGRWNVTRTIADRRALARPSAVHVPGFSRRTADRALIHRGRAAAAWSSRPAFPHRRRLRHLTHCAASAKNLSAKKPFPPRSLSATAKMLPVGAARGTTGTPGRAPPGAAAPTVWHDPVPPGPPGPPPHSRKPQTKRNKSYVHAMPLLPRGVAAYPNSGSRPPGHSGFCKVTRGSLLGRPPRSGTPGTPAPVLPAGQRDRAPHHGHSVTSPGPGHTSLPYAGDQLT